MTRDELIAIRSNENLEALLECLARRRCRIPNCGRSTYGSLFLTICDECLYKPLFEEREDQN